MPMCSRSDARCEETECLITEMYRCPFGFYSGACNDCDRCYVENESGDRAFINVEKD